MGRNLLAMREPYNFGIIEENREETSNKKYYYQVTGKMYACGYTQKISLRSSVLSFSIMWLVFFFFKNNKLKSPFFFNLLEVQ